MAIPILGPIVGSAISGVLGIKGAKRQNQAQIASAREQMAFQERMSSTAHQREVEDLRKAGLNPILSGTGGAGAAVPSGAQADIVNEMEPGISSAMQARRMWEEVKLIREQRNTTAAEGSLAANMSAKANFEKNILADSAEALVKSNVASARQLELENVSREVTADLMETAAGPLLRLLQMVGLDAGTAAQIMRSLRKR